MGKSKSAAALRQQQRARAREAKNQSNTASETSSIEIPSSSPKSVSSGHEESDLAEAAHARQNAQEPFDMSAMRSLLTELNLESEFLSDANVPSPSGCERLCEIRPSDGKGLGVFALVDIPKGTRIMADQCLFSVLGPKALYSEIEAAFDALSPEDKRSYMQLRCPDHPGRSPVIRIWDANCFAMGHDTGIFLLASRINHSCTPNAHFAWNANIDRETVHAIIDISAGQEIETSYCPTHKDAYSRRRRLEAYGFDCSCDACQQVTHTGRVSEERRRQLMELDHEISDSASRLSPRKTSRPAATSLLKIRLEIIQLLEEEQLRQRELGVQLKEAAMLLEEYGEREAAKQYAKRALRNNIRCFGIDSPIVQEDIASLTMLQKT
ncbi:MAG: hypothetical protein Q9191_000814 [Dirinaria sp. TL-2023a]